MLEVAVGYHGTTKASAEAILEGGFATSKNPYDWLGDGVYFFQGASRRAWNWAWERHGSDAAVLGCEIQVVDFLDFTDPEWARFLTVQHDRYIEHCRIAGLPMPVQKGMAHFLDREVINYSIGALRQEGVAIRGVRGVFAEGDLVYPDSAIYVLAHVQIAVLELDVITSVELESAPEGAVV